MSWSDLVSRYQGALELAWPAPPAALVEAASVLPAGSPAPRSPLDSSKPRPRTSDVRGTAPALQAPTSMISRCLPGVDVTFTLQPLHGDGLSVLQGRVWLNPRGEGNVCIFLVRDDHVMAQQDAQHGATFRFCEILLPGWHLELLLPDGSLALLEPGL